MVRLPATAGAAVSLPFLSPREERSSQASYGESYLLLTVLACVLGGIDPAGGVGKVIGLLVAVAVLQEVGTGFNLLGFSSYLATSLWGIVLIAVILTNRLLAARLASR